MFSKLLGSNPEKCWGTAKENNVGHGDGFWL